MNLADKIINNRSPQRLIVVFLVMLVISAAVSMAAGDKVADICAENQIAAYLSAAGGGGIGEYPDEQVIAEGEKNAGKYSINRKMNKNVVFGREKVSRTVFGFMFGISSAVELIWFLMALSELLKMYGSFEKLRADCVKTANDMGGIVELQGEANDCLRRVSEGARLLSERMDLLSRTLEADKTYLSEFLGDFSHQIKNALAVVRLNTDILADAGDLSPERRDELTDEIQLNLDDMEQLVVQAIKLARLEADTVGYSKEPIKLADICQRAIKRISPALRKKNIAIETELPEDIVLMCDRSWLCEAVENILKNSADHSGCSEISVKIEEDPARVKLVLSDNGAGIPQRDIPKLFERFGKKSSDITMKSAGLGLSIALKIIRQHGGDILVYSEVGSGTRFEIVFIKA